MESQLNSDSSGLGLGGKIPNFQIVLTPEQAALLKDRKASIFQVNGQNMFQWKDDKGNEGAVIYLIWT